MNILGFITRGFNQFLPRESFRRRYLSGTIWMIMGVGVAQISTFAATIIAARILGSGVFGKYGILQSTLGMFAMFAGLGMGLTNKRFVGEMRDKDPIRCGQIIGFSSVVSWFSAGFLSLTLFISAPFLAVQILNAPELALDLQITAGLLLLNGLNEAQIGALLGLEEFQKYAIIAGIRAVVTFPLVILGVYYYQLAGLVGGMVVTALIVWIVSQIFLQNCAQKADISIRYENVFHEEEIFWKFAVPTLASGIFPAVVFWVARTLMVQYPKGYTQLGLFTAAEQWLLILSFIPGQMTNVSQPILSNLYGKQDGSSLNKALTANIVIPTSISAITAVFIILLANKVPGIYGKTFAGMSPVLIAMCFVGILRVLGGTTGTLLVTFNKMWISFFINLLWGITLITTMYFLAYKGAMGLAIANIVAYLLHAALCILAYYLIVTKSKKLAPAF